MVGIASSVPRLSSSGKLIFSAMTVEDDPVPSYSNRAIPSDVEAKPSTRALKVDFCDPLPRLPENSKNAMQ